MNTLPKDKFVINRAQGASAAGGCNTEWDPVQLPIGGYSNTENVRVTGPGFYLRPGLVRHHTTDIGEVLSLYSYDKGVRFWAQTADGDVYEASSHPPTAAAGTFGGTTPVLDISELNTNGIGDIRNASWSRIRDNVLFSQGKMQHAIRPADEAKPLSVIFWAEPAVPAAVSPPRIIDEETADITDDVTDGGSGKTSEVLTFDVSEEDSLFICTQFPGESFSFIIDTVPGGTKNLEFSYFDGDGWTVQSGGTYSDGTSGWDDDGTLYAPIDERSGELPTVMFGQSGYWYRFKLNSNLSSPTVSFDTIYYDAPFRPMENVMSPFPEFVVEAQVEGTSGEFSTYAASSIAIGDLVIDDYIYFSTIDPIWALYAEVGATPNTTASTAISALDVWDGAWSTVGTLEDHSNGVANTGYISWDRTNNTPVRRSFNGSRYRAYWYRMKFDKAISSGVILTLSGIPYFDIATLGQVGEVSTAWKQRGCFTFSKLDRDIYVSQKDRPNILNGSDYAILSPGDGRYNRTVAMLSFFNELMTFQSEEGSDGGCVTLFEGYSPDTFGKLVLSTRLGTFSQSSVCIVDASTAVTIKTDVTQTLVAFISKYGIFMTDGQTIVDISEPIRNYFDPKNPEYINVNAVTHHWIEYDRQSNTLRVGLETIQSSGGPNVFPVYHLELNAWGFDSYNDARPTAFCEVTADPGTDVDSLQYLAAMSAADEGDLIYRCKADIDYDEDPDGTKVAIQGALRMEFSNSGNYLEIREFVLRMTSNANYTLTKNIYENGQLDTDETETFVTEDEDGGDVYRERILENVKFNHQFSLDLSWENTEENWGVCPFIYDFIHEIYASPNIN